LLPTGQHLRGEPRPNHLPRRLVLAPLHAVRRPHPRADRRRPPVRPRTPLLHLHPQLPTQPPGPPRPHRRRHAPRGRFPPPPQQPPPIPPPAARRHRPDHRPVGRGHQRRPPPRHRRPQRLRLERPGGPDLVAGDRPAPPVGHPRPGSDPPCRHGDLPPPPGRR